MNQVYEVKQAILLPESPELHQDNSTHVMKHQMLLESTAWTPGTHLINGFCKVEVSGNGFPSHSSLNHGEA